MCEYCENLFPFSVTVKANHGEYPAVTYPLCGRNWGEAEASAVAIYRQQFELSLEERLSATTQRRFTLNPEEERRRAEVYCALAAQLTLGL